MKKAFFTAVSNMYYCKHSSSFTNSMVQVIDKNIFNTQKNTGNAWNCLEQARINTHKTKMNCIDK